MLIWLLVSGEPFPVDGSSVRLFRTGMLAHYLANAGHQVVWWGSDFNHFQKIHRFGKNAKINISKTLSLMVLHGCGYQSHISFRRFVDHLQVAAAFSRLAPKFPEPDVIVAAYPTIELCFACARYAQRRNVPLIIDIRDLWPDIFLYMFSGPMLPIAKMALFPYQLMAQKVLACADAIFSITDPILNWGLTKAKRKFNQFDQVIPFGYIPCQDMESVEPALKIWLERGVDPRKHFIISFVGSFGHICDIETVIAAARMFWEQGDRNVRFVLCGRGDLFARHQRHSAELPNIVLPGWIDLPQITALLKISKLGLVPYISRQDFAWSIPNKVIEYLSAGLPILTCLDGLVSKMVVEHSLGFIYRAMDVESLFRVIANAMSEPGNLSLIASQCHRLFEERFRNELVLEKYEKAIKALVSNRRSGM